VSPPTNVIKVPLNTQKTICVFTSGWVIVTVQIHGRNKLLKGLKWPLQMVFTSGWVIVSVQIHGRNKLLKGLKWPLQMDHQYSRAAAFGFAFCLPKPGFLKFIWIFSSRNHVKNQYLPHSTSYQINSIKSCSTRSFQQHQRQRFQFLRNFQLQFNLI